MNVLIWDASAFSLNCLMHQQELHAWDAPGELTFHPKTTIDYRLLAIDFSSD